MDPAESALPGAPCSPCGPTGPGGPAMPCGPGSPCAPMGPGRPGVPWGPEPSTRVALDLPHNIARSSAEGAPRVTNAVITLKDTLTRIILTNTPVNAQGELLIHGLVEGYYDLEVRAEQHQLSVQTLLVTAELMRCAMAANKLNDALTWQARLKPASPVTDKEVIADLVAKVVHDLSDRFEREVPGRVVGERVMESLRELDKVAYVRFASVYRRFEEVTDFVQVVKKLEETKHDSATFRLPGF